MHIWHHDYDGTAKTTVNFGTAKMPADPPAHLGFDGVETFPDNFFSQEIWPIPKLLPRVHSTRGARSACYSRYVPSPGPSSARSCWRRLGTLRT